MKDGKLFNDGRPVDLIQIEDEKDFDILLNNIIDSGYYDSGYFETHINYQEGQVKFEAFFMAAILRFLGPRTLLELGCGRGDILFLIGLDESIKVRGIDFSLDIYNKAWHSLKGKIDCGDILDVSRRYGSSQTTFDTFCAFDLWEHIHPKKLHKYIEAIVKLADKDALFFFTIPAFGEDRVFGEIFPLELEENRDKFNQKEPFDFLNAESTHPAIPANGHLIWAHTEWWQKQFEYHGLVRAEALEGPIHKVFDEHLFYASKSFFIFHLNSSKARKRAMKLSRKNLDLFRKWKLLVAQQKVIGLSIDTQDHYFIDLEALKSTLNHAEHYMILYMKKRIGDWFGIHGPEGGKGFLARKYSSIIDRRINKGLENYVRAAQKRDYIIK